MTLKDAVRSKKHFKRKNGNEWHNLESEPDEKGKPTMIRYPANKDFEEYKIVLPTYFSLEDSIADDWETKEE
jgi:hypothetical protein